MSGNTVLTLTDISFNNDVRAVKYDSVSKTYYIGGSFTSVTVKNVTYNANCIVGIKPGYLPVVTLLGSGLSSSCYAVDVSGTSVYAGGMFTSAGGVANTGYIAKWDIPTSTWSSLGGGLSANCNAIRVYGNDVYVGGIFNYAKTTDGTNVTNTALIAKWSTVSSTWSPLVTGINADCHTIDVSGSSLYIGGAFTTAGGISANRIAIWDISASSWSAIGSGLSNSCRKIVFNGSTIYAVGGDFTVNTGYISRWNGTSWTSVISGINGMFRDSALDNTDLYVTGNFTDLNSNTSADYVAKWNTSTSTWSALGSGVNGIGYRMIVDASSVNVFGAMTNRFQRYDKSTSAWSSDIAFYTNVPFKLNYYGEINPWVVEGNNVTSRYSGNVGVGVTNPSSKLDVSGVMNVTGVLQHGTLTYNSFPRWTSSTTVMTTTKNVGIGTTNATDALNVTGTYATSSDLRVGSSLTTSGTVLDISGSIRSGLSSVATKSQYSSYAVTGTTNVTDVGYTGGRSGGIITSEGGLNVTNSILLGPSSHGNYALDVSGSVYMKKYLIGLNGRYDTMQPELVSIYKLPEPQYSGISPYIATYFAYIDQNKRVVINSVSSSGLSAQSFASLGNIGAFTEQVYPLSPGETASKIYTSGPNIYVITESGKIFSMGYNTDGQCGLKVNGTSINFNPISNLVRGFTHDSSNVAITSPFVKMIMASDLDALTAFGLTQDGRLYGVGLNTTSILATGNTNSSYTMGGPWRPLFSDGVLRTIQDAIVVGGWDTTNHRPTLVALDSTGSVWASGNNVNGQVGQNSTTTTAYNRLTRVKSSATTDLSSNIVSLYGCGTTGDATIFALHSTGDLYVWGRNSSNTKYDGTVDNILVAKKINSFLNNETVTKVWTGFYFDSNTFVKTTTGKIYGTGSGDALGIDIGSTPSTSGWQELKFFNSTTRILDNFYTGHADSNLDITFAKTYDTCGNYSLWVTGKNGQGCAGLGMTDDIRTWVEVSLPSDIVKRIVTIASSNWGNRTVNTGTTVIHLDDGTALIAGKHIPISNNDTIFSKFIPLCRYTSSDEPN